MAEKDAAVEKSESQSPVPLAEVNNAATGSKQSTVTSEEWIAMHNVLSNVYAYRVDGDHDPSKVFHRKVNKRFLPTYYDVIKEPVALSTIKAKIHTKQYQNFSQYIRDFALIFHNAQVYNRPDAGAYVDALTIKDVFEKELQNLVDENIIKQEVAPLPFLGEIPPPDEDPVDEDDDDDEDDEDDDDEEEGEDSDEEGGKRRKRRRGMKLASGGGRGGGMDDSRKDEGDIRKRRGRPPRVDTPMEARIKNIVRGLRKPRNSQNQSKISHFEKLPDKTAMPEYYNEIKNPMAFDHIKKKLKRKKYHSVEQFMKDIEQIFDNAKLYNEDESQIYKDAVDLQREGRILAEQENKRPDTDYVMEDGRLPMPDGILHNGELWKVGDWVHIQNPNDLTKPIVAQIYRTWQDSDGQKWVNACWYYRPEQTIHRFDRHFYESEVVKTGQYRDHHIDEVIDRCFVMFFTRFNKGRPRGFPPDKDVYVCEARYNEERHKLNKIKTWASCLPDEVRDKDYEMDLFDVPKKMKKMPSPIAYLLKDDAKETDDLPKPIWGAENAPPKIGAVHKRPRDPKDSPPPEPTPSPPPAAPAAPVPPTRQLSQTPGAANRVDMGVDITQPFHSATVASPSQPTPNNRYFSPQRTQRFKHHSASPVPVMQPSTVAQPTSMPHHPQNINDVSQHLPAPHVNQYQSPAAASSYNPQSYRSTPVNYNAPPTNEVYHLPDAANMSIPQQVRQQFHCDANDRVLFFTSPPLDTLPPYKEGAALGHSVRYLAAKAKREALLTEKRRREQAEKPAQEEARKKARKAAEEQQLQVLRNTTVKALDKLQEQLAEGTRAEFRQLSGDNWKKDMETQLDELEKVQAEAQRLGREYEEHERVRKEEDRITIPSLGVALDNVYL